jgi:L-ascorbate metabolism protein UlaG (beta-lactamase superfamily)
MNLAKTAYYAAALMLAGAMILGLYLHTSDKTPGPGEAIIRYADWSGWVVETSQHVLIFDYVELMPPTGDQTRTIEHGFITAEFLKGKDVRVFVSHIHGDHYDPEIWQWRGYAADIRYFLGWNYTAAQDTTCLTRYRENYTEPGMEVHVVNKPESTVPEVAFLVEVDGLTIYHSGDVVSSYPKLKDSFRLLVDYVSGVAGQVDLAFISKFGSWTDNHTNPLDIYTLKTLRPRVVFPQHAQGGGVPYMYYELELSTKKVDVIVGKARQRGDMWLYRDGSLVRLGP